MSATPDPLLTWRAEFPITATTNYLISNSLGPMPRATRDSLGEYMRLWDERGVRAWADAWWEEKDNVAGMIEDILGVAAGTVTMHQNVAMASQAVVSCFSFDGPRNKVVFTDLNFPSVMYLYEAQAERGAEIVRVPSDDGVGVDLQRLLDAIDEKTLLVPISHVLFRSSVHPRRESGRGESARKVGAFVILDVFQSIGTLPLNLGDGPEWRQRARRGRRRAQVPVRRARATASSTWHPDERNRAQRRSFTGLGCAQADPFAFSRRTARTTARTVGRFLNGTPNVPALYAGHEGIRIVRKRSAVDAIREKSKRQTTSDLIERAQRSRPDPALARLDAGGARGPRNDLGHERRHR